MTDCIKAAEIERQLQGLEGAGDRRGDPIRQVVIEFRRAQIESMEFFSEMPVLLDLPRAGNALSGFCAELTKGPGVSRSSGYESILWKGGSKLASAVHTDETDSLIRTGRAPQHILRQGGQITATPSTITAE